MLEMKCTADNNFCNGRTLNKRATKRFTDSKWCPYLVNIDGRRNAAIAWSSKSIKGAVWKTQVAEVAYLRAVPEHEAALFFQLVHEEACKQNQARDDRRRVVYKRKIGAEHRVISLKERRKERRKINQSPFKTQKEAEANGWVRQSKLRPKWLTPKQGAKQVIIRGAIYYRPNDLEAVYPITQGKREGLRLKDDAEFAYLRGTHYWYYPVYPESSFIRIKRRKICPPKKVEILSAIFAVNRSAKRYRDSASELYMKAKELRCIHGLVSIAKQKKDRFYELKDIGIAWAFANNLIHAIGESGELILYRGSGYCFHSKLLPKSFVSEGGTNEGEDSPIFIKSKPREKSEVRLKDAIFTLENLKDCRDEFDQIETFWEDRS